MLTKAEAEQRVARGAAHLDVVRPGWHDRIDVGTLELSSCIRCVVGQLGNGYDFIDRRMELGMDDGRSFGIDLQRGKNFDYVADDERVEAWRFLQDAWIAAIADRKIARSASDSDSSPSQEARAVDAVAGDSK